jgi:localization factor PodJL
MLTGNEMPNTDRAMAHSELHEARAGLARVADEVKDLLSDLSGEIEASQRRTNAALGKIETPMAYAVSGPAERSQGAASEPWDPTSAEALAQVYEAEDPAFVRQFPASDDAADAERGVLGARFADVALRIRRALGEMRPQNSLLAIEERFEAFQARIGAAVEDVAKRSDVDGLRIIEAHVNELEIKVDLVRSQLARLDGIEAQLHTVSDQLSDRRLATDLEAVARIAAEEVASAGAARHDELKALIETSISERRRRDEQVTAALADLGGPVNARSNRDDELKTLLEASTGERRKGEEQAITMLDTLQQALIEVLDRLDAIEASAHAAASPSVTTSDLYGADPGAPSEARQFSAPDPVAEPALEGAHAPAHDGADESWRQQPAAPFTLASSSPLPRPAGSLSIVGGTERAEGAESLVDRLRRDFIVDAQRAKLKAAARSREERDLSPDKSSPPHASSTGEPGSFRDTAGGPVKVLGLSPKLLAGALALVVAINGGLLLVSRGADGPAAPASAIASPRSAAPNQATSGPEASPLPVEKPRSDVKEHGNGMMGAVPAPLGGPQPMRRADAAPLAGGFDFETEIPDREARQQDAFAAQAAFVPRGMTLQQSDEPPAAQHLAMVYEQQVMAGRSAELGEAVANATLTTLLPEQAAGAERAKATSGSDASGAARVGALDLPPVTVGPLSLRLAAANGDPSAEFEVGARLAEGKGTDQDFKEAMRWYQRSAAQGFAQAQYRLGTLFERGLGTPADLKRARVWYQRAADQGNVKAMHNLAVLSAGLETGSPDYATAAQWFSEAAERGLADSQYNLAVLLENGLGVPQNAELAYKWYRLSAQGGDQDAAQRRDQIKAVLTPDELAAAEELVNTFHAKPQDAIANDARTAGEDWKRRQVNAANG